MSTSRLDEKGLIVTCPNCGQKNRTPLSRLDEQGVCGKCKATLPYPKEPIEIANAVQFDTLIQDSALPVVADFWAPWCGPCLRVAPELEKVAAKANGQFLVVKINTEALPSLGERHAVQSIPLMAVFHRGHELARTTGARPAADILKYIYDAILK